MSLGETLLERGKISADQLQQALAARKGPHDRIDRILVRMGFVNERDVLELIGEQLSIPVIDLSETEIDTELLKDVPSKAVHRYSLMPISRVNGTLRVATANPFDLYAFDELRMLTGLKVEPVLASESEISQAIKRYYGIGGQTVEDMIIESDADSAFPAADSGEIEMAQEATVVKLVNEIIIEAIRDRASDVHIEPFENNLRIRYRIDGVLHTANVPQQIRRFQAAIISRIKILSNLNIAEKRLPQDGGFKVRAHNREIDIRVSIIPTPFGEAVVLRILDKQSVGLSLAQLGMDDAIFQQFREIIAKPYGIILVTGPTGAGKTTTLYSALNEIVSDEIKILTIEDPVEYYIDGVSQVQISPRIGLTFATGLRSFLRHDPDVILVGEIRDAETADVAINASLTGHLVLSTLHTNDAATAPTRLLDMGVEPFLVASSLEGVMAQRLVRGICAACKQAYDPEREKLPKDFALEPGQRLHVGAGCRECRNTGYKGRLGIFELLMVNEPVRELIVQRSSASRILECAKKDGLRVLREDGWDKVRAGKTTPEEVLRVSKV